jgi:hypothetical protein
MTIPDVVSEPPPPELPPPEPEPVPVVQEAEAVHEPEPVPVIAPPVETAPIIPIQAAPPPEPEPVHRIMSPRIVRDEEPLPSVPPPGRRSAPPSDGPHIGSPRAPSTRPTRLSDKIPVTPISGQTVVGIVGAIVVVLGLIITVTRTPPNPSPASPSVAPAAPSVPLPGTEWMPPDASKAVADATQSTRPRPPRPKAVPKEQKSLSPSEETVPPAPKTLISLLQEGDSGIMSNDLLVQKALEALNDGTWPAESLDRRQAMVLVVRALRPMEYTVDWPDRKVPTHRVKEIFLVTLRMKEIQTKEYRSLADKLLATPIPVPSATP